MTLKEIMSMDINAVMSLNREELAKATQIVAKNVRRRSSNVIKSVSDDVPAIKSLANSGGLIYTKGKNLNELRHEFIRGVHFLSLKTSTVAGAKAFKKKMSEIAAGGKKFLKPSEEKEFWKVVNKLTELNSREIMKQYGSDSIFERVRIEIKKDAEPDLKQIEEDLYQELQKERIFSYDEYPTLSEFFTPE